MSAPDAPDAVDTALPPGAPLRIETLSVFPEMFEPIMSTSIMGRARRAGVFEFRAHDLRAWTHDRHNTVDDAPFGGGQGMLMKPAPFYEAIDELCPPGDPACVVFFTPTGEPFTQAMAQELSRERRILFVCGHYEGMDERVYRLGLVSRRLVVRNELEQLFALRRACLHREFPSMRSRRGIDGIT